jgi:3',5'-cyclic AMP phosphodiesterase CpdA
MAARALLLVGLLFGGAASAAPLSVVVISDLNSSYGSVTYEPRVADAIRAIVAIKPDLVISTGDMVAGQRRPHLSEAEVRAMWDAFHRTVTAPLEAAGIPLAVTPGNHDASAYGGFQQERKLYSETWQRHRPDLDYVGDDGYPFTYAFDMGGVRFASLDATTIGALSSDQEDWLDRTMAGAGPTRIVFSHLPLWPVAIGRETEIIGDPGLAGHFSDLGVDLHLSGHHHAYYPGAADGIAYVAQACLGAGPRALIGTPEKTEPGFTILDIAEDGHIEVSAVTGPALGTRLDPRTLPATIGSGAARLERLDLARLPAVTTRDNR